MVSPEEPEEVAISQPEEVAISQPAGIRWWKRLRSIADWRLAAAYWLDQLHHKENFASKSFLFDFTRRWFGRRKCVAANDQIRRIFPTYHSRDIRISSRFCYWFSEQSIAFIEFPISNLFIFSKFLARIIRNVVLYTHWIDFKTGVWYLKKNRTWRHCYNNADKIETQLERRKLQSLHSILSRLNETSGEYIHELFKISVAQPITTIRTP